jgi:transposase-like protein
MAWKDVITPKPFPTEFRDDVIRVAEKRDPEVTLAQITKATSGVHVGTLGKWVRQARIEAGEQPGETKSESRMGEDEERDDEHGRCPRDDGQGHPEAVERGTGSGAIRK